jgi:hypothetical protein
VPIRITSVSAKAAYVIVGYIVLVTAAGMSAVLLRDVLLGAIVDAVLTLVLIGLGARWFRADGEDRISPRPLWRLTGRPTAGFVVATLAGIQTLFAAGTGVITPHALLPSAVTTVVSLLVTIAYLASSMRLRSLHQSTGEIVPRNRRESA